MKTDKNIVTYSWGSTSQGICGHIFEAFEIFFNLNEQKKPSIFLIADKIKKDVVFKVLYDKYPNYIVNKYFENIIFETPKVINTSENVIITDGVIPNCVIKSKTANLILCSKKCRNTPAKIKNLITHEVRIFHDRRLNHNLEVYENTGSNDTNHFHFIHMVKQVDTDLLNSKSLYYRKNDINVGFIYATNNCRKFNKNQNENINRIIKELNLHKILFVIDTEEMTDEQIKDFKNNYRCEIQIVNPNELPIENLMGRFDVYIYTSTPKKWDCSSRFLVECSHYNKHVCFTDSVKEYLKEDLGLSTRLEDLIVDQYSLFGKNKTLLDLIN